MIYHDFLEEDAKVRKPELEGESLVDKATPSSLLQQSFVPSAAGHHLVDYRHGKSRVALAFWHLVGLTGPDLYGKCSLHSVHGEHISVHIPDQIPHDCSNSLPAKGEGTVSRRYSDSKGTLPFLQRWMLLGLRIRLALSIVELPISEPQVPDPCCLREPHTNLNRDCSF